MNTADLCDAHSRHRVIAVLAALVAVLALVGIGAYGLTSGPDMREGSSTTSGNTSADPSGSVLTSPTDPVSTATARLPSVRPSVDPATFARNVSTALFNWDTASGFMPLDYTSMILAVGDPSGAEQAGLAADIATYLPTRRAWVELRQYATTQHLSIDDVYVPKAWGDAVAQAQPGQLAEGTTAYTIEGTRHRTGLWNGEKVTSKHPVAFTVFIVCAPTYDTCHLLRLSQLDNPLR